jgi:3-hydroxyisobutyrate dehydrogenase
MPVTAATREVLQQHIGKALSRPDAEAILAEDFARMAETMAELSGMTLESEKQNVSTGL